MTSCAQAKPQTPPKRTKKPAKTRGNAGSRCYPSNVQRDPHPKIPTLRTHRRRMGHPASGISPTVVCAVRFEVLFACSETGVVRQRRAYSTSPPTNFLIGHAKVRILSFPRTNQDKTIVTKKPAPSHSLEFQSFWRRLEPTA